MAAKFGRKKEIIVGSRGSRLALAQSQQVIAELSRKFPDLSFVLKIIKTKGDLLLNVPLSKIGGKGLFVKEIEQALLNKTIDLAVHSLKDLPTDTPKGLIIAAIPKREDPRDAVIYKGRGLGIEKGIGRIGTGSLRRKAQLLANWPKLEIVDIRGNLDTRIRKMEELQLDAIVIALAGMKRLKIKHLKNSILSTKIMLPAPGQGALAIECRSNDESIIDLLKKLNHMPTATAVRAERALLLALGGGCQVPIGAFAKLSGAKLKLEGVVADTKGRKVLRDKVSGNKIEPEKLGEELAQRLINMGAKKILDGKK